MSLLRTETKTINGNEYSVRVLPLRDARLVYARIQRILSVFGEDAITESDMSPFMLAGMSGAITAEDLEFYTDKFGPLTNVTLEDGRVITLTVTKGPKGERLETNLEEVFAGQMDVMLEWLDFCVQVNFKSIIEKLAAALKRRKSDLDAAKAQPKA